MAALLPWMGLKQFEKRPFRLSIPFAADWAMVMSKEVSAWMFHVVNVWELSVRVSSLRASGQVLEALGMDEACQLVDSCSARILWSFGWRGLLLGHLLSIFFCPEWMLLLALACHLAVGQNQWDPVWGRCTTHFRTYFSGWIGMFSGG